MFSVWPATMIVTKRMLYVKTQKKAICALASKSFDLLLNNFLIETFLLKLIFRAGFIDASTNSTHYPGRICKKPVKITINEQHADTALSLDSCDVNNPKCQSNEICTDKKVKGEFVCDCAENSFRFNDNTCRLFSACESLSDCDKNAVCVNSFDSYKCQCRQGFFDS